MGDFIWKALLAEFIGTFILVFIGASAVALLVGQGGSLIGSALAFGLTLMILIYIWGSSYGAHFNPAVSFGFAVAGQMNWWLMLGYWVVQILGAIAAAALVAYFFGTATGAGASVGSLTNTDAWRAVLMEAILTFFLVMTYLFIYRNSFLAIVSGLAVGLVLTVAMFAGGPLTGASMNPARSLGTAIFSNNMGSYWIYIVGPLIGALVAALIYKLFTADFGWCDKLDCNGCPIKDECGNVLKVRQVPCVDACGNELKDECCNTLYKEETKYPRDYGFTQENFMTSVGGWLSSHGLDPQYIKQEFGNITDKTVPDFIKHIAEPACETPSVEEDDTDVVATIVTATATEKVTYTEEVISPISSKFSSSIVAQPLFS